jgi:hypothetical protein
MSHQFLELLLDKVGQALACQIGGVDGIWTQANSEVM